jgi:hypothetical protein
MWYTQKMRKFLPVFWVLLLLTACQTPSDPSDSVAAAAAPTLRPTQRVSGKVQHYRIESVSYVAGFSLLVNGAELLVNEGGKNHSSQVDLNDWMVSGNNELAITLFWPETAKFAAGTAAASFKLFLNNTLLREFKWPAAGVRDTLEVYPYTINDTFRASGFPRVMMDRAERVISSAGNLPRSDQEEIAVLSNEIRKAFTEKNIPEIDRLFRVKYTDLASARFTTVAALRTAADGTYSELMEKEAYAVRPLTGRYGYFSTADDKVVRLVQGRIGFPEPALVITYRDGRRTVRYDLDLYLAKIDGKWVIIR